MTNWYFYRKQLKDAEPAWEQYFIGDRIKTKKVTKKETKKVIEKVSSNE